MSSAKMCERTAALRLDGADVFAEGIAEIRQENICESMGGRYETEIQYCNDVAG